MLESLARLIGLGSSRDPRVTHRLIVIAVELTRVVDDELEVSRRLVARDAVAPLAVVMQHGDGALALQRHHAALDGEGREAVDAVRVDEVAPGLRVALPPPLVARPWD